LTDESRRRFLTGAAALAAAATTPLAVSRLSSTASNRRMAFELNETGAIVYQRYREGRGVSSIAVEIADRYEVSLDDAARDVRGYVEQLRRVGLVT